MISAVLVTHDHADHIKTAGGLSDKYNVPVYSTSRVIEGINRSIFVKKPPISSSVTIEKEKTFSIGDFRITAFEVPHDASDCVGYFIETGNCSFVFATDIGHITPTVGEYISRANHLVLESNYDMEMLIRGTYPQPLKDRVSGSLGHLSNQETAEFLATHFNRNMKDIWLCHLSADNNKPELAYQTVSDRLLKSGIRTGADVNLYVLNRVTPSEIWRKQLNK
jgi:phosphoribosyl 1,2-cyclic phosphodiesterase